MKRTLFVLLGLISVCSYGDVLRSSKNYTAISDNEDGSVSVIRPMFSNPNGTGSLYLSLNSDMGGVCRLFGFSNYVTDSVVDFNDGLDGSIVVIGSDSNFKDFESNYGVSVISSLSCRQSNKPVPKSINYDAIFFNDDGSTTIQNPKFKINQESVFLSDESDMNGVCRLFGFKTYVLNSLTNYGNGQSLNALVVADDGRFQQYKPYYIEGVSIIQSVMCR